MDKEITINKHKKNIPLYYFNKSPVSNGQNLFLIIILSVGETI